MKTILCSVFLCLSISASAQTQPSYNPDFDNDGLITITDVLELLVLFGQQFVPEPCQFEAIEGCTNPEATNFNPDASVDDGSCILDQPEFPETDIFCSGMPTLVFEVFNPATGRIWMDRNLGASQAATSSTDEAAYGDLYQWGRRSDGHQCRNSATTAILSSSDQPQHGDFITTDEPPSDWRSPENGNLWQGVNGVNNPCPTGYRLPTDAEWNEERASWISNDAVGAYASPLKLTLGGFRSTIGFLNSVSSGGVYWSSSVFSFWARRLSFNDDNAGSLFADRAAGFSVRCIKD